jgi:subtilisin
VGVAGVAPGADVYFAAAGEDDSPSLDPTRLANSIDMLVEEYECHLITVSAGDSKQPTDEIRFSVQAARKRGCLCLFAAGNQGGEPFYPARYSEVLAVGACGRSGTTPEGSYLNVYEQMPGILGEDGLFLWRDSAYGEHVELLAAGVGTLWCINGRVAFAACGTSYASPVATGVLAVLLSSNEEYLGLGPTSKRTEMALYSLRASCLPLGLTGAAVYGLPVALQEA